MAWFRNHYECARCETQWTDEWSCTCDDDCPRCGARHMSPSRSDDLSEICDWRTNEVVLLKSADDAEHRPNYEQVAVFPLGLFNPG